ncbi:DUF1835 domain-containing protein [Paenibacillus antarcticus]|uniref:DUF1835 domain-containing protein n=1 Tax=Paenibacillus antarcticus TaxID=253703 RepID=A0A168MXV5_9BACL|nr:DUF1835 domain-containing protein [Paenibacillus antarcticus]OAB45172.1 hypothetical protein PBAT_14640 [Paenibacillus antarcticus]
MKDLRKMMNDLTEIEAKSILYYFFLNIERLDNGEYSKEQFVHDTTKEYKGLIEGYTTKTNADFGDQLSHVHVMFGDSSAGGLKFALKQMGLRLLHHVIVLRDNYAVGPMQQLNTPEGRKYRREWFRERMHLDDDYDNFMYEEEFFNKVVTELKRIPEHIPITIWTGNNALEQIGLRYTLYLFRNKSNPIYVINTEVDNHTLFDTPELTTYYRHTGEINPEKLGQIMQHNESVAAITRTQREAFEQEWSNVSGNSSDLRIWEQEEITHVNEDYYDQYIIETVSKLHNNFGNYEFIKSARVIGEVIGNLEQFLTDSFFEHRLRQLIYSGILEIKGVPKAMRYYSVRLKI